ncbi:hypothetical protein BV53_05155 [Candidatus Synechococcus spongiarum LMB bulk15N]|uniref:Uncharacterized protein n=1 Tax=Candidatus Synechococcus spongiarum LMB bulk15N TaxID=1943583 RepID=A0A1T1D1I2_9SYNE|nr:hypothetical protein BV53_05155 [Candidatus Synechococcus spongiarum LMB bulk15N]
MLGPDRRDVSAADVATDWDEVLGAASIIARSLAFDLWAKPLMPRSLHRSFNSTTVRSLRDLSDELAAGDVLVMVVVCG